MTQPEVTSAYGKGPSPQTGRTSHEPQTAAEYINSQLLLEEEAREALPYAFDTCTRPLGPLRQSLFSCLTCNPPPASLSEPYNAAGICYSCSISCHGEHTLVELFNKRNFVCDCGSARLPSASPCKLRINSVTGTKGVHSETPEEGNRYDHNFRNRFCGCEIEYNAFQEKGTMFQCLGLGSVEDGGCGEDWYHPGCLVGLGRDWYEKSEQQKALKPVKADPNPEVSNDPTDPDSDSEEPPLPPGFPKEEEFDAFICYKCVAANPWIARYAGTEGFLPAVYINDVGNVKGTGNLDAGNPSEADTKDKTLETADDIPTTTLPDRSAQIEPSKKRKAEDDPEESFKKPRASSPTTPSNPTDNTVTTCHYPTTPINPYQPFSLFLKPTFRAHLCHCTTCFPLLAPYPALLEEEPIYEPPLSASSQHTSVAGSVHNSLLERGERALNNIDRVRAIEGAMVYNKLKEKVKSFLKPFAETGTVVGAEDIKKYFEELRGDSQAVKDAAAAAAAAAAEGSSSGDNRREQSG